MPERCSRQFKAVRSPTSNERNDPTTRAITDCDVTDEPSKIKAKIKAAVTNKKIHAIIINGGTGISRRDSTFEAVDAMLEKRLVGFGEVFRYLTYQDVGSPAIMSRATAGIIKGRVLFSTPGSENAVRLAMEKLILPELGHLVKQLTK